MANNTVNVEVEMTKGFDLHRVRYFDTTECKYEGDGAENLIVSYDTYNPVIPQLGGVVWFGCERYIATSIDYSPDGNVGEGNNSVMVDISLVNRPLPENPDIDDDCCCCCEHIDEAELMEDEFEVTSNTVYENCTFNHHYHNCGNE